MNPYLLLAAAVAFAVSCGGAYLQGRSDGRDKCIAESVRDDRVAQIAGAAAADAAASAISSIKVQSTTIRSEVQREVIEKPVYRDCVHGPDVMRNINAAIIGAPAAGPAASSIVPTADTPQRAELR